MVRGLAAQAEDGVWDAPRLMFGWVIAELQPWHGRAGSKGYLHKAKQEREGSWQDSRAPSAPCIIVALQWGLR